LIEINDGVWSTGEMGGAPGLIAGVSLPGFYVVP
jgi:hypothetical protein